MLMFVEESNASIAPITARVVGKADAAMGRSRAQDSALGNWISDAMREAAGADIALQNPGGIRTDLDAGPVTVGDIYEIMPFDNRIATVRLTGAQVKEVLETGVSPTTCIQVSGITFAFDPAKPRGERVRDLKTAAGEPIDPARGYVVAANDFMAQGGDGFTTFARGQDLTVTGILVREAMEKDLEKKTARGETLGLRSTRRITNLGASAAGAR
jgi:2',3'-cyclic-nucleotide 2'-phosphodiesterase (5'-nucleotidase family)